MTRWLLVIGDPSSSWCFRSNVLISWFLFSGSLHDPRELLGVLSTSPANRWKQGEKLESDFQEVPPNGLRLHLIGCPYLQGELHDVVLRLGPR